MNHLIRKQVIHLRISRKDFVYRLQQLVSDRYWQQIRVALEKVFDELSIEDRVIQIDRLEIDLGIISEKDIEKDRWIDQIYKMVSQELSRLIAKKDLQPTKNIRVKASKLESAEQWL